MGEEIIASFKFGDVLEQLTSRGHFFTPAPKDHCARCLHTFRVTGSTPEDWAVDTSCVTVKHPDTRVMFKGNLKPPLTERELLDRLIPLVFTQTDLGDCEDAQTEFNNTGNTTGDNAKHFNKCPDCQKWAKTARPKVVTHDKK